MSLVIDEFGRPFILLREQQKQKRLQGLDALKSNIQSALAVANVLKTSFGPKGMDKIIMSQDGDVTITNDGAEILEKMDIDNEVGRFLVELSQSQDDEVGDGTTGVVILAGALLSEAVPLLEKGIHPLQIAKGFEEACADSVAHLEKIAQNIEPAGSDKKSLIKTAMTTLSSKFVSNYKKQLAEIVVEAVLSVADLDRKDVNLEMIRIEKQVGSSIEKTMLVDGIVLDKCMSHMQMPKKFVNPKIALLTCAFEPPNPKTKYSVYVSSVEQYNQLLNQEQQYFRDMVRKCKDSGADIVFCQWGFDDEANHLLMSNNMPAVRWVGGAEMESLAIATGAKIVARFDDLTPDKLGTAGSVEEVTLSTKFDKMLFIEKCPNSKALTILLRAGNNIAIDEAKRSLHDSLCVVRNLVKDSRIVYGGGSCELSCAAALTVNSLQIKGMKQYGYRAFGQALEVIPLALAENAGFDAIAKVTEVKKAQKESNSFTHGVSVEPGLSGDMKEQGVIETFIGKRQQFQLATQMAKILLKTDDVIKTEDEDIYQ